MIQIASIKIIENSNTNAENRETANNDVLSSPELLSHSKIPVAKIPIPFSQMNKRQIPVPYFTLHDPLMWLEGLHPAPRNKARKSSRGSYSPFSAFTLGKCDLYYTHNMNIPYFKWRAVVPSAILTNYVPRCTCKQAAWYLRL